MLLRCHRIQCKRTYSYQKLGIDYEICQLPEALLSGAVRNLIDTCIRDYCLVENYTLFLNTILY